MTASDIVLDSWAWWEILLASPTGARLRRRYLRRSGPRVHTSSLAFGEVAAKLVAMGRADRVPSAMAAIRARSLTHDVTPELAERAGLLRAELRRASAGASLADAIMLATARELGAVLISDDPAFAGQPDVAA